ncbi:MAG: sulfite exporter TauE/SafE family protein [Bacteroidales bacterium]
MTLLTSLLVAGVIVLVSSFVRGITGFGLALTAFPFLVLFIPPKEVVVLLAIINLCFSIIYILRGKRSYRTKDVLNVSIFCIAGVLVGFFLLKFIPDNGLKLLTGSVIVLSGISLLLGVKLRISNLTVAYSVSSLLGGILAGSTTIGGPVVALILTGSDLPRDRFRNSMSLFFLFSYGSAVIMYLADSMINSDTLVYAASSIPFLVTGLILGEFLSKKINQKYFRILVLVLLLVMGSRMIITSL